MTKLSRKKRKKVEDRKPLQMTTLSQLRLTWGFAVTKSTLPASYAMQSAVITCP